MMLNTAKPNALLIHIILIVVIVAIGLGILNTIPIASDAKQPINKPKKSMAEPLSKADFSFYEVLKADEVLITGSNYISTPKDSALVNPILLQIAATSSESAARNLANKLTQGGLKEVIIVKRPSSNGMLYLVRTTPYLTYDKLKAGLAIAEKLNHHPDRIELKSSK